MADHGHKPKKGSAAIRAFKTRSAKGAVKSDRAGKVATGRVIRKSRIAAGLNPNTGKGGADFKRFVSNKAARAAGKPTSSKGTRRKAAETKSSRRPVTTPRAGGPGSRQIPDGEVRIARTTQQKIRTARKRGQTGRVQKLKKARGDTTSQGGTPTTRRGDTITIGPAEQAVSRKRAAERAERRKKPAALKGRRRG